MGYNPSQERAPKGADNGGQWVKEGGGTGGGGADIAAEPGTAPLPPQGYRPDVEQDTDGDGITDRARVGVGAHEVPPPPVVPRLPNLTPQERAAESAFADAYEADPGGMARQYLGMVRTDGPPVKFEADAAKNLFAPWAGDGLSGEQRAEVRATMNTALHQTASAVTKRAFLIHLDQMSPEERQKGLLVTVGGCGAGKGFALKNLADKVPEVNVKRYGVVWDSAGDQNATENPWLLKEAARRGIPVTYVYVSSDPKVSWADKGDPASGRPPRGVVARARNTKDGRMVDAAVFADSYALGARNHHAFSKANAGKANFVYVENGKTVRSLPGVPPSDLTLDRRALRTFAAGVVEKDADVEPRVKRGALSGARIWGKKP
jgi:hypothetical protein